MEEQRRDLVVILAGYPDRMERFFGSNPGFRSRIAHHIDFPDYSDDELVDIAVLLLDQQSYQLSAQSRDAMRAYIGRRRSQPHFANARSVRNALDRARLRQAHRHLTTGVVAVADLMVIEDVDLLASRVFSGSIAIH